MKLNTNVEMFDLVKARDTLSRDYEAQPKGSPFKKQFSAAICAIDAILEQINYRIDPRRE